MSTIKFTFTLVFFFAIGMVSQAQVAESMPQNAEQTTLDNVQKVANPMMEMELIENFDTDETVTNTNIFAAPAESNTAPIATDELAFNFNHKQYFKPVVKKSALC